MTSGYWTISGSNLLAALRRAAWSQRPEDVYVDLYDDEANEWVADDGSDALPLDVELARLVRESK
jgi:hypothetical protein